MANTGVCRSCGRPKIFGIDYVAPLDTVGRVSKKAFQYLIDI